MKAGRPVELIPWPQWWSELPRNLALFGLCSMYLVGNLAVSWAINKITGRRIIF